MKRDPITAAALFVAEHARYISAAEWQVKTSIENRVAARRSFRKSLDLLLRLTKKTPQSFAAWLGISMKQLRQARHEGYHAQELADAVEQKMREEGLQ